MKMGVPILGTAAEDVDAAEDRERFDEILEQCQIPRPAGRTVFTAEEAKEAAHALGSVSYTHLDVYKRQVLRNGVRQSCAMLAAPKDFIRFVMSKSVKEFFMVYTSVIIFK